MIYKVAYNCTLGDTTLKKDRIIDTEDTIFTDLEIRSLRALKILIDATSSKKVNLTYDPDMEYLEGDTVINYSSLWTAKTDIPANKSYPNQTKWEEDWALDVQGA